MSGGWFSYRDMDLKTEIFGYADEPGNQLQDREITALVWDVLDLLHTFDWAACGDLSMEDYVAAKAEFRRKWLGNRGVRVRRVVDDALRQAREELYATYGLEGAGGGGP